MGYFNNPLLVSDTFNPTRNRSRIPSTNRLAKDGGASVIPNSSNSTFNNTPQSTTINNSGGGIQYIHASSGSGPYTVEQATNIANHYGHGGVTIYPDGTANVNVGGVPGSEETAVGALNNANEGVPLPETPELVPYTGNTYVPMIGTSMLNYKLINQLQDPNSTLSLVQSGDPNMELFNRGVAIPAQQQLTGSTLPQIAAQQSGGPYGASYYSGATQELQSKAITDSANEIAKLRMEYGDQAVDNMLKANQTLSNIFSQTYNQRASNLNRQIEVYYKNQGLTQQEFQNEVTNTNLALELLGIQTQAQLGLASIEAQSEYEPDLFSSIFGGALTGAAAGSAFGPWGALIGGGVGAIGGSVTANNAKSGTSLGTTSGYLAPALMLSNNLKASPVTTQPSQKGKSVMTSTPTNPLWNVTSPSPNVVYPPPTPATNPLMPTNVHVM